MHQNIFSDLRPWECLEIDGPDAKDFLQRLTSADFRRLHAGAFTPGTLLQPTGKLVLYFKALCLAEAHYLLLVLSAQEAYDAFEKMHFRENLKVTPRKGEFRYFRALASDESSFHALGAPSTKGQVRSETTIALNEGVWNAPPFRYDIGLVFDAMRETDVREKLKKAGFAEVASLEPYRLRAFSPDAPNEINSTMIPLEAGLDDAVHENKGCYPGQEVIERIRTIGQVPRTLVQIRGDGEPPRVPAPIHAGSAEAGHVTSAASDPVQNGWVGLGFVKRVFAKPETTYTVLEKPVHTRFKGGA